MLVLSRHKNEQIVINNGEIVLTVVDIRGDKVRLGIEAPKEVPVHRKEVHDAIQKNPGGKNAGEGTNSKETEGTN